MVFFNMEVIMEDVYLYGREVNVENYNQLVVDVGIKVHLYKQELVNPNIYFVKEVKVRSNL